MLNIAFQCDACWFCNLKGRTPRENSLADNWLLAFIRRVNLDAMWAREKGTVAQTYYSVTKMIRLDRELGLTPKLPSRGPWPLSDPIGFQVALQIIKASTERGRNDAEYQQYDSIRKLRSGFANTYESGLVGTSEAQVLVGDKGRSYRVTASPTNSAFFARFMRGLEKRMGKVVKTDLGLAVEVCKAALNELERDLVEDELRRREIVMLGSYLAISYGYALRGNEGFMTEASDLIRYIKRGREHKFPHVTVPLLGRFKGETNERTHCVILANESTSGLKFRFWVEQLVALLTSEGRHMTAEATPAFCDKNGYVLGSEWMNTEFQHLLVRIQQKRSDLIPESIDVMDRYRIFRSIRRGAKTRAQAARVEEDVIQLICRWSKVENKQGGRPNLSMSEAYTEISQLLTTHLIFSQSL